MNEPACIDDGTCRCIASDLFELLGRKYAMDIVCIVANHDPARFGEIEAHLPGASTTTLSTRLDELEVEGLVDRIRYDEIPPRVEYELTETGRELADRLRPLEEWIVQRAEAV